MPPLSIPKLALLVLASAIVALLLLSSSSFGYGRFGAIDFVQYWGAFSVGIQGGNPYDPASLLSAERVAGFLGERPLMFWSPPWLLTLFAPILTPSFEQGALLWLVLSGAAYAACCLLAFSLLKEHSRLYFENQAVVFIAALTFYPAFLCLKLGQSSFFLGVAVSSMLYCLCRKKFFAAGIFVPILLIKPHLFLIFLAFIGFALTRARECRFFISALLMFGALLLATHSLFGSQILIGWLHSLDLTVANDERIAFLTPNLVGVVRSLFIEEGVIPGWSVMVNIMVPGVVLIGVILWAMFARQEDLLGFAVLSRILFVSVWAAPYGWGYDLVVLTMPLLCFLMTGIKSKAQGVCVILAFCAMWAVGAQARVHQDLWPIYLIIGLLIFSLSISAKRDASVGVI